MSAVTTILSGCLAVSAVGAGALWYMQPETEQYSEPEIVLQGDTAVPAVYQPVPMPEPILYSVDFQVPVATDEIKELVQPMDERGEDAMIFEMEALALMPFDDAIVSPFD